MVTRIAWSLWLLTVVTCCLLVTRTVAQDSGASVPPGVRGPAAGGTLKRSIGSPVVPVGDPGGHGVRQGATDEWPRTRAQGAMLARIIVSERSEVLRTDDYDRSELDWFASVVVNSRALYRSTRTWSQVMERLAPHVTRARAPTQPRHEWTSTLLGCTEARPAGWVSERDGNWDLYALRWQSFCLDVRDRWMRGDFEHHADAYAWGNLDDARQHMCRVSPRNLCPLARFVGVNDRTNVFFGFVGSAVCNEALREEFVEAHCEGRR